MPSNRQSSLSSEIPPIRQLLKTALIAIPVMTIISFIMPLLLEKDFNEQSPVLGIFMVIINQLFLWTISIVLLYFFKETRLSIVRFLVGSIILFLLGLLITSIIVRSFNGQLPNGIPSRWIPVFAVQINYIAIFLIIELVVSKYRQKRILEDNLMLVRSNLEAKQGQLMQQLKPHFLFNSLNTLRNLMHEDIDKAETYLLKLSNILRYSINPGKNDLISLKEEMHICYQFLEIQQIRHEHSFYYTIDLPLDLEEILVPVFSIQLLIENALKHNKNTKELPLRLKIHSYQDYIEVVNTKNKLETVEQSSGIGLLNLGERCHHMIGKELIITETDAHFSVKIPFLKHAD